MQHHYQQTDLQTLIDLLAKETGLYTKALGSGKQGEIQQHKTNIDALVIEITRRKQMQQRTTDQGAASAN
jgi:hypothetical protein